MAGKRATISIDLIADASKAKAGLKQAEQAAGSLQNQFKNVAKTASAAFATREIVNFAQTAVGSASDLAESMNAVTVTFGKASDGILQLGESAAKAVGMSQRDFNAFAVQFAGFTKQVAGATGDVVAVTDELTVRIADFASVMNLDIPRAAQIFQSSLAGSTEPIRAFGIDMSAAAVAAFAVEQGMVDSAAAMTEADKVAARYALLMQETAQMAGDFANTSDGLANSQRILAAEMENAKATIGEAMIPAVQGLMGAIGPVLQAFTALPKGMQQTIAVLGLGVLAFKSASTTLQGFGVAAKTANVSVGLLTSTVSSAILILSQMQERKLLLAQAADRVTQALDAETGAVTENTRAMVLQDALTGELGDALDRLGISAQVYTDAALGNVDAQQQVRDTMLETSMAQGDVISGLRALFSDSMALGDATRIVQIGLEGANQALQQAERDSRRLGEAQQEAHTETGFLNAEMNRFKTLADLSEPATAELTDAVDELWKSTDRLYAGMFALNPELEEYLQKLDDDKAVRDFKKAIDDYEEAQADATTTTDELAAAHDRVARELANVITELGNVPQETQAELTLLVQDDELDEAQNKVDRLLEGLNLVRGGIQTEIMNLENARSALSGLQQAGLVSSTIITPNRQPERAMAAGGIVTGPTVARLGEYGPEAVIPLTGGNARGGLGATYNIVVNAGVGDPGSIGQKVVETIKAYERRNGNSWRQ